MGVHGDDVVRVIRDALAVTDTCPSQTEVEWKPNPEMGWPNRDGTLVFTGVGRDYFRAFKVTVEALPYEDFDGETDIHPTAPGLQHAHVSRTDDRPVFELGPSGELVRVNGEEK